MRPQDIATLARRAGSQVREGLAHARAGSLIAATVWLNAAAATLANLDVLLAEKPVERALLSLVDAETPEADLPTWMETKR